jgi:hypothetical protein
MKSIMLLFVLSGSVAEWLKALVLKTSMVKAIVGSNPTTSVAPLLGHFFKPIMIKKT